MPYTLYTISYTLCQIFSIGEFLRPLFVAGPSSCTCPNGTPATGAACTSDGAVICASCGTGHHLSADGSSCVLSHTCTCLNGTPPTGAACTSDGAAICASCGTGHHLSAAGDSCEANTCTCRNGSPATGAACTSDGAIICLSCDAGFDDHEGRCYPLWCRPATVDDYKLCTRLGMSY